jgi:hypothetical protein
MSGGAIESLAFRRLGADPETRWALQRDARRDVLSS